MNALVATFSVFAMLFGSGATVYAAQDDLPNQPLYPVKTLSEDTRLWFNNDPQTEVDLLMQFVQTRIQEMTTLAAEGITPPAQVNLRLEQHIEQALQIAAGTDDVTMQGMLLQVCTALQTQERAMLQTRASGEANQTLTRTRVMLQERIRLVENGLADPQNFRNSVRHRQMGQQGYQNATPGSSNGSGESGGPQKTPSTIYHGTNQDSTPCPQVTSGAGNGAGQSGDSGGIPSSVGNNSDQTPAQDPQSIPSPGTENTPAGHNGNGQGTPNGNGPTK